MRPLDGLRVLDLSRVVSGPFAGRMLSDLGADVVKVEPPEGDVTRNWGAVVDGLPGFYFQQNAGKRALCIDLKTDDGVDLVRRLASEADVVIENFRPGVADRLGIGWDDLSAGRPDLVMLSISGFGQDGPEVDRRAYAPVIHAEAGFIGRQARFDDRSASDPMFSFADTHASLHGLVAVLSALRMRDATATADTPGQGQHIDIAMLHAMLATDDYSHHTADASPVVRLGGHVMDAPDGPVLLSGEARYLWHQISRLGGVEDPTPPGSDLAAKIAHRDTAMRAWVAGFDSRAALCAELDRLEIAWADVRDGATIHDSPTVAHRGVFTTVDSGAGGERRVVDSPYRFSDAESGVSGPAPHLGQHHDEVLAEWLDLSPADVETLEADGVLRTADR